MVINSPDVVSTGETDYPINQLTKESRKFLQFLFYYIFWTIQLKKKKRLINTGNNS